MSELTEGSPHADERDLAGLAMTLQTIERLLRRAQRQLGEIPQPVARRRRKITLREAALSSLREKDWMSLTEWEQAMAARGYKPPTDAKRPDQTRRSLASLAARSRHLIEADGRGNYRMRETEQDPLLD